ncbi:MAG: class I SAM-dependent methyltransferase [Bacteroidetes bacterium]|nr:class I SAM-dependent methyltransferase [Bacteroidota bacterium]MCL2302681.1 class I SAM-dependent methyltransferase [Lentimicrobiaceae bacterium]
MQERHKNRQQYFNEQSESTRKYVLPYILQGIDTDKKLRVLEIGCGEGGNLLPFLETGCECYGVELSETSYNNALIFYEENPLKSNLQLLNKNIYEVTPDEIGGAFDVVFLRDVIEHIPAQEQFMKHLKQFIAPTGVVFFAFPPWRMPFGGHQQVSHKKWISRMPYIHAFPKPVYKTILKILGSSDREIEGLLNLAETGISIKQFEKIIRQENYTVNRKTHWFINPNYQTKFGFKPRRLPKIFQIPYLQDFYTTAAYYLLKIEE